MNEMLFNELNQVYKTLANNPFRKGIGENNDCGVIAIAAATGAPYEQVHRLMSRFGRKQRRGSPIRAMKLTIRELGFKAIDPEGNDLTSQEDHARGISLKQPNGSRYTPKSIVRRCKRGNFIGITRSHALAVVNGEVADWSEKRNLRIVHLWTILPNGAELEPVVEPVAVERKVGAKVEVNGVTYRSVKAAFIALGLDLKPHQKFRYELKRSPNGQLDHMGFTFKVAA